MDLQCPAFVLCLLPDEPAPLDVGGHRVAAAYTFGSARPSDPGPLACADAPAGKFWGVIAQVADLHRGEAVVLYADAEELQARDLIGVALRVDSSGASRISPTTVVDNGY